MKKKWDCILIGRACIDILTQVDEYPPEDSKVVVAGWKQGGISSRKISVTARKYIAGGNTYY